MDEIECPQILIQNGQIKCLYHQEIGPGNNSHCKIYEYSSCIECENGYYLYQNPEKKKILNVKNVQTIVKHVVIPKYVKHVIKTKY